MRSRLLQQADGVSGSACTVAGNPGPMQIYSVREAADFACGIELHHEFSVLVDHAIVIAANGIVRFEQHNHCVSFADDCSSF